jgi:hypothetical protein
VEPRIVFGRDGRRAPQASADHAKVGYLQAFLRKVITLTVHTQRRMAGER